MCVTICSAIGMLAIGKMKPDSSMVGRNDDSSAIWNATCWLSATVEMNSPMASAPNRYNAHRQ